MKIYDSSCMIESSWSLCLFLLAKQTIGSFASPDAKEDRLAMFTELGFLVHVHMALSTVTRSFFLSFF